MIEVGNRAPDFTLKDQNGKAMRFSSLKGKKVLLSFRPLAWTPVWSDQMESLEENHDRFDNLNTVALGIGVDSVPTNKAWAKSLNIEKTRLLADFWPHGGVAKMLGIFREKNGFSERVNIVIDEAQKVIFVKIYDISRLPDIEEIINFLSKERRHDNE